MKRLLIIDDEVGARESLREVFYNLYEVTTAENAMEGLSFLARERADLIILDMVMPRMGGVSFLREARQIHPDLPVLVLTASTEEGLTREVLSLGAVGFVRKPFDVQELRHLVAQSLTASELPRQRDVLNKELVREFPLQVPL